MHQWLERKIAPSTKPRPIRLRNDNFPRSFRGDHPELYPDDAAETLERFKPRSVLVEYKGLALVFLAAAVAFGVFFVNAVRTAPPHPPLRRGPAAAPAPAEPPSVYIEMVPAPKEPAQPAQPAPR